MNHQKSVRVDESTNAKVNGLCAVGTVVGIAFFGPLGLLFPLVGKAIARKAAMDKAREVDADTEEQAVDLASDFDSARNPGENNLQVDFHVGNIHRSHHFSFPPKQGEE